MTSFYEDILGMRVEPLSGGYWKCDAPGRSLLICEGESPLRFGAYGCAQSELQALRQRLEQAGISIQSNSSPLFGGVDAFQVSDPDGNILVFGHTQRPDRGRYAKPLAGRLQHLVIASTSIEMLSEFYQDIIGFQLSDRVEKPDGTSTAHFLRGDNEHHCFAIFAADENRLDHHCYEAQSWNDIRDWADHLSAKGVEIMWGPGRHGAGNNLFLFFRDPDGNWLEISAELESVAPGKAPGLWPHSERTLNLWGKGLLRS